MNNHLNKLTEIIAPHFEITTDYSISNMTFDMYAVMESDVDKPLFVLKKTTHVFSSEIIFAKSVDNLNKENFENMLNVLIETEKNSPNKTNPAHTFTFLTLYIMANSIDDDAIKLIKKAKFGTIYKKPYYGFTTGRICVVDTNTNKIVTNKFGKDASFRIS